MCAATASLLFEPSISVAHYRLAEELSFERAATGAVSRVSFRAFGRLFDLRLEPSTRHPNVTVLDGTGRAGSLSGHNVYLGRYRGTLAGDPDSRAAVAVREDGLEGVVRTADGVYFLEPAVRLDPGRNTRGTAVYRPADVDRSGLDSDCAAHQAPDTERRDSFALSGREDEPQRRARGVGAAGSAEISLVADSELLAQHGAGTADYVLSLLDSVDAIYSSDHDTELIVTGVVVLQNPATPLSDTRDSAALLNELAVLRATYGAPVSDSAATLLITGRNLSGSVIGRAYVGTLCHPSLAIGLIEAFTNDQYSMVLIAAHEIGHVFGAEHDGESFSPCATTPEGYLMWPVLTGQLALEFSACSRNTIAPVLAAAGCADSPLPDTCGDDTLDPDEQCDDGNNVSGDCCAYDCTFEPLDTVCGLDGNPCTVDLCDGAGVCLHPAREGSCHDDDICTIDGICDADVCIPDGALRPMSKAQIKVRFEDGVDTDRFALKAALPVVYFSGVPTIGGLTLRVTVGAVDVYTVEVPPELFEEKSLRRSYRIARDAAAPGGLTSLRVKYRKGSATLLVQAKASGIDLDALDGQPSIEFQAQVGDDILGHCAAAVAVPCEPSRGRLKCQL